MGTSVSIRTRTTRLFCFPSRQHQLEIYEGGEDDGTAAFGPAGVEIKVGMIKGGPIALGISPIDIGSYVTAELKERPYDVNLSDATVTTAWLSYSLASKPFSILAGYQHGVRVAPGVEDGHGLRCACV